MPELADGSVDMCVTSPPYFNLRNYNTARWEGGNINCDHIKNENATKKFGNEEFNKNRPSREETKTKDYYYKDKCEKCGAISVDEQIGIEDTPEEFINRLANVFDEVKRVLKDDGTLWINIGDSYARQGGDSTGKGRHWDGRDNNPTTGGNNYASDMGLKPKDLIGIPWMLAFELRKRGWYLRQDIIWQKPNPMPESVTDRCTKSHEYIFLLSKSQKYYFDSNAIKVKSVYPNDKRRPLGSNGAWEMDGREQGENGGGKPYEHDTEYANKRDVWTVVTKPYNEAHFATFPEELIIPCIKAGSKEGGVVLDPFFGAGTTGVVSLKLNRSFIGFEINEKYLEIANKRLEPFLKQYNLF